MGEGTFFSTLNPELWIAPPMEDGVLVGRLLEHNGAKAAEVKVQLRSLQGRGVFEVMSYAKNEVNSDTYYDENLVRGDIPAGDYEIYFDYNGEVAHYPLTIQAGIVNFITYRYGGELVLGPPPAKYTDFVPPDDGSLPGPTP